MSLVAWEANRCSGSGWRDHDALLCLSGWNPRYTAVVFVCVSVCVSFLRVSLQRLEIKC